MSTRWSLAYHSNNPTHDLKKSRSIEKKDLFNGIFEFRTGRLTGVSLMRCLLRLFLRPCKSIYGDFRASHGFSDSAAALGIGDSR
jgi:hypothetical protein